MIEEKPKVYGGPYRTEFHNEGHGALFFPDCQIKRTLLPHHSIRRKHPDLGAPSTVTVKQKMMSAGLVIPVVQYLLWSVPARPSAYIYDSDFLDCFVHFAFCNACHVFLMPRPSVAPSIKHRCVPEVQTVLFHLQQSKDHHLWHLMPT